MHVAEIGTPLALVVSVAILSGCATAGAGTMSPPTILASGRSAQVSSPQLTVVAPPGFRLSGPHDFAKREDNGYHFDVSLVSFVSAHEVVSVAAERLQESGSLNYDSLAHAKWPNPTYLARASGCAKMTSSVATAMPAESGMAWILEAGFNPNGSYAYEAALLIAPDHRHEASIELIAEVASCGDTVGIEAALNSLRGHVTVNTIHPAGNRPDHQ